MSGPTRDKALWVRTLDNKLRELPDDPTWWNVKTARIETDEKRNYVLEVGPTYKNRYHITEEEPKSNIYHTTCLPVSPNSDKKKIRKEEEQRWAPPVKKFIPPFTCWEKTKMYLPKRYFIIIPYFFAVVINVCAIISMPWIAGTTVYIIETNFNQNAINGTLNGVAVLSMSTLRLGLWTACYTDLDHTDTCLPWNFVYQIIITEANNSHTVVQPLWSGLLKVQIFAGLFTVLGCFYAAFLDFNHYFAWLPIIFTALVLVADYILYVTVRNTMQTFGAGVATDFGAGFNVIILALVLIVMGCSGHWYQEYRAKEKKAEQDEVKKVAADNEREIDDAAKLANLKNTLNSGGVSCKIEGVLPRYGVEDLMV